jgi:hypothetical protein
MTELYEITTLLQREFSLQSGISLEGVNRINFSLTIILFLLSHILHRRV